MANPTYLRSDKDGVQLSIKLQPRASSNEIVGEQGGELRVRVTAPPVDAAANEALLRFLADALDCPRGRIGLIRGQTSRHKTVKVHGLSLDDVAGRLRAAGAE
jgi:uncharacterized protein (TIGR00251 family)